jgi:hypothetical protein
LIPINLSPFDFRHIEKLDGKNYSRWIKIIIYLLKKEKIWSIVNGVEIILVAPIKVVIIPLLEMGKGNIKNKDDKNVITQIIFVSNV